MIIMASIRDVRAGELVKQAADELKPRMDMPQWAKFVKTGVSRERPPEQENWWYMRSASILRKLCISGKPVGVQKLRTYYGGLHRRGHKPAHFARGSGKVLRVIMQDLEKAGLVKKEKKGRTITSEGQKLLNRAAKKVGK